MWLRTCPTRQLNILCLSSIEGSSFTSLHFPLLPQPRKSTHSLSLFAEPSSNLFLYQQLRRGISLILTLQGILQNFPLKPCKFGTLNGVTLFISCLENRYSYAAKAPEIMHFNSTDKPVSLVYIELKASFQPLFIFFFKSWGQLAFLLENTAH